MKNFIILFLIKEFIAKGLEIILEDLASLICSDDTKLMRQSTKKLIHVNLNPNERESLFLLVVNLKLILCSHLLQSAVCSQKYEDLQKTSYLQLPSTFCMLPVAKSLPVQPVASCQAGYGSLNMEDPDEELKISHHPNPGALLCILDMYHVGDFELTLQL